MNSDRPVLVSGDVVREKQRSAVTVRIEHAVVTPELASDLSINLISVLSGRILI